MYIQQSFRSRTVRVIPPSREYVASNLRVPRYLGTGVVSVSFREIDLWPILYAAEVGKGQDTAMAVGRAWLFQRVILRAS